MGLSSKKATQTTQSTTTPTNPSWVNEALQGYTQRVSDLGTRSGMDYVAPLSQNQNQAIQGASQLGQGGYFDQARGLLSGVGDINPYLDKVVGSSLASFDDQAGRTAAGNAAAAAKNNAFGGSRYGILQSQQQADSDRNRALLESGLLSDAFNQTTQDKLAASGLLGNLGTASGDEARANIGTQLQTGAVAQDQAQREKTADITLAQILGELYGQGQLGLFQGQNSQGTSTVKSTPSLMQQIGQGAETAASLAALFSDIRLKRDIRPLEVRNGRQWYAYRYIWSDEVHEGIMAHENMDVAILDPSGFLKVDYGAL